MNHGFSTDFGLRDGQTYIIGREGDIQIDSPSVSRQHAEMVIKNSRVFLRDLNSTNGIFLLVEEQRVRLTEGYISHDQPLMIGKVKCTLRSLLADHFISTNL